LFGGAVDECFVIENALSDIAAANFLKDSSRVPQRLAHLGATNLDTIEMGSGHENAGLRRCSGRDQSGHD